MTNKRSGEHKTIRGLLPKTPRVHLITCTTAGELIIITTYLQPSKTMAGLFINGGNRQGLTKSTRSLCLQYAATETNGTQTQTQTTSIKVAVSQSTIKMGADVIASRQESVCDLSVGQPQPQQRPDIVAARHSTAAPQWACLPPTPQCANRPNCVMWEQPSGLSITELPNETRPTFYLPSPEDRDGDITMEDDSNFCRGPVKQGQLAIAGPPESGEHSVWTSGFRQGPRTGQWAITQ